MLALPFKFPSSFKIIPKKSLGIDIGTSSIKVVELSRWGERRKLENYGEMSAKALYAKPFRTFEKSTLLFSDRNVSRAIQAIIEETKIKTRRAIFSIPDFSSFFTNFDLPQMTKEELGQAVVYEARRHVPIPLGEVTLDWQIIDGQVSDHQKTGFKILLVAVPNEIINQYRVIAEASGLELFALEAEVFGLLRSLITQEEKRPIALIDIGAQSTTCSIIDNRILKVSHSFDISGNQLTDVVAKSLSIDYTKAEKLKAKYGLLINQKIELEELKEDKSSSRPEPRLRGEGRKERQTLFDPFANAREEKEIRNILLPLIDIILREIEKTCKNFYHTERKKIQKIIIAGSTALLPGLKEYCQDYFKKEVEIANPFSKIFYPPILEGTLKKMGPPYAIAIGMALRGLE